MTPDEFHAKMSPMLSVTPYWSTPSSVPGLFNNYMDPGKPLVLNSSVAKGGSWTDALERAVKAANPFAVYENAKEVLSAEVQKVGDSGAQVLKASADAVGAAGSGIKSGFKWAVLLIVLGLAVYLYLLLAPFIPRPSGGK